MSLVSSAGALARAIERVIDTLLVAMLVVMVCAMCYQVFGRYVIGRSPAWAEELARYMMVWMTFLGAVSVLRGGGHLTVTALVDALGPGGVGAVLWLRDIVMLGLCVLMCRASAGFAVLNASQESAAMEIPMTVPNIALAAGFGLLALQIVLARLAGRAFPALAGDEF
jgi:TRAP-type transport system small permease protein